MFSGDLHSTTVVLASSLVNVNKKKNKKKYKTTELCACVCCCSKVVGTQDECQKRNTHVHLENVKQVTKRGVGHVSRGEGIQNKKNKKKNLCAEK